MRDQQEVLHSKFSIETHKKTFVNYLEVILFPDGHVEYAIPSHQEKLIAIGMKKHGCTRDEYINMCPQEYFADYITWLQMDTGCVSIWYDGYDDTIELTVEQALKIDELRESGCMSPINRRTSSSGWF